MCPGFWLGNKLIIGMLREMNDPKTRLVHWFFAPGHVNPLPVTFIGSRRKSKILAILLKPLQNLTLTSSPLWPSFFSVNMLSLFLHHGLCLCPFPCSECSFTTSFHELLLVQILIKTPIFSGCHP